MRHVWTGAETNVLLDGLELHHGRGRYRAIGEQCFSSAIRPLSVYERTRTLTKQEARHAQRIANIEAATIEVD
jgi:hypothetical protein